MQTDAIHVSSIIFLRKKCPSGWFFHCNASSQTFHNEQVVQQAALHAEWATIGTITDQKDSLDAGAQQKYMR